MTRKPASVFRIYKKNHASVISILGNDSNGMKSINSVLIAGGIIPEINNTGDVCGIKRILDPTRAEKTLNLIKAHVAPASFIVLETAGIRKELVFNGQISEGRITPEKGSIPCEPS